MKSKILIPLTVAGLCWYGAVNAAEMPAGRMTLNIEAQPMEDALNQFAQQSGLQLLISSEDAPRGRQAPRLVGSFTADSALKQLLAESGLHYEFVNANTVAIRAARVEKPTAALDDSNPAGAAVDRERSHADKLRLAQVDSGATATEAGQDAADSQRTAVVLDEVVVSGTRNFSTVSTAATKIPLPIVETPQAITVFTDEMMKALRITGSDQLADYAPGLQEAGQGDGSEVLLVSRGFAINREHGYKVNGITVDSEVGSVDYSALDRVEVIRGPASVLYGEVDYGATINTVLKQPGRNPIASVSLELGSFDHMRTEADIGGQLDSSGRVSGRIAFGAQDSATFIHDTDNTSYTVSPSVSFEISDATRLLLQGYYSTFKGGYTDGFSLLEDGSLPAPPVRNHYGASFNENKREVQFYFAELQHDFGNDLQANVRTAWSRVEVDSKNSIAVGPATLEGDMDLFYYMEKKVKPSWSVEASLQKTFELGGREQTFMVSGDWRRQKLEHPTYNTDQSTIKNIYDGDPTPVSEDVFYFVPGQYERAEQKFYGVTALAHVRPTEKLAFLGAARWTGARTDSRDFRPIFGRDHTIAGAKDDTMLYRLGAVYTISPALNVYASFSEGVIFNADLLGADGQPINPERGVQYEVGVKGEVLDRKATYAVSVFSIKRTDSATTVGEPDPIRGSIYTNVGKQFNEGIELELLGRLSPSWNLLANYTYLDVDIRESGFPAEVGHRPADAPEHAASMFATHEVLSGALRGLSIGGGLVYRSEREVDSVGTFQLPSYTRFDARVAYAFNEHFLLEANAINLTNEKIYASSYGAGGFGLRYLDGRAFYLRGTYGF